jgi:hypothetical protein
MFDFRRREFITLVGGTTAPVSLTHVALFNLKSAAGLGIPVPPNLLVRADEVTE